MTRNKKKVLFFMPTTVGGAEKVMLNYAHLLDDEIFEIVYVLIGGDESNIRKLLPETAKTYSIKIRNINKWGCWRICKFLKQEKPDSAFSSMFWINVRLLIACRFIGVKAIVRNNITINRLQTWMRALVRWTYKYAHLIIVQQEEMYQELCDEIPDCKDRIKVVYNPFLPDVIDKMKDEENPYPNIKQTNFLWAARFSQEKGHDILVKAFEKVVEKIPNAHLYLLGKCNPQNDFYKEVTGYIKEHDLTARVHVVGFDSNPYRWIYRCDCFVMPSRIEGLPNALIEAMYLRRPVVATECIPIVSRMVEEGYNGYVVEPESVVALATAMEKAIELKNFRMIYKPASKEDVEKLFM